MEPISLFGRELDRAAVAGRMRQLAASVALDPPHDDAWRTLTATFGRLWGKKTLTLTYDPAHCSEPEWPRQMDGMRGYFSRFPDTPAKQKAMMLTHTFGFVLGTAMTPDARSRDDPRFHALLAVAELLDGVLFTPSALLDARGRVLFSAHGAAVEDPAAQWPRVIFRVKVPAAGPPGPEEEAAVGETAPGAGRVAVRALALAALTLRGMMDGDGSRVATTESHERLVRWAREVGAEAEMEPEEREVLLAPPGRLPRQVQVNAIWRLEGLGVLMWALGRFELPPHDRVVDSQALWQAAGMMDADAARALLAAPALHPRDEIAALRKRLLALHWRLREYGIRRRVMDFAGWAATAWFGPFDLTGIPLAGGDLAIGGVRIDRAPQDGFNTVQSIARERHLAANWLWEGPELYSMADEST